MWVPARSPGSSTIRRVRQSICSCGRPTRFYGVCMKILFLRTIKAKNHMLRNDTLRELLIESLMMGGKDSLIEWVCSTNNCRSYVARLKFKGILSRLSLIPWLQDWRVIIKRGVCGDVLLVYGMKCESTKMYRFSHNMLRYILAGGFPLPDTSFHAWNGNNWRRRSHHQLTMEMESYFASLGLVAGLDGNLELSVQFLVLVYTKAGQLLSLHHRKTADEWNNHQFSTPSDSFQFRKLMMFSSGGRQIWWFCDCLRRQYGRSSRASLVVQ